MVEVKKVEYMGWENCYKISNGKVEAIVTTDVGPRIIHFSFEGDKNVFLRGRRTGRKSWG